MRLADLTQHTLIFFDSCFFFFIGNNIESFSELLSGMFHKYVVISGWHFFVTTCCCFTALACQNAANLPASS